MHRRTVTGTAAFLLGMLPVALLAQPSPSPAPTAPAASASGAPAAGATEEAQKRYMRALELFNEGAYEAALLDFRRAYELAPSWKILFNIGQVNVQLNDYAGALNAFERYLAEGGAEVPATRSTEVNAQLERLKGRVAYLEISSNVPGVEVTVDDLAVGKTPMTKPVLVNAGRRRIAASAAGRLPQNRVIEAAGGDRVKIEFEMLSSDAPAPTASASVVMLAPTAAPPSSRIFWPGWVATGVLGAGAAVVGVLSLGATSDHDAKREQFGVTRGELDDAQSKARRMSITADVLLGAALVTGGVSLYLSLRKPAQQQGRAPSPSLGLGLGPGAAVLRGSF